MTAHIKNLTDDKLVSLLHSVTETMLNIENKKLKLDEPAKQRVGENGHALADEIESRGLMARAVKEAPISLQKKLLERGIK